MFPTRNGKGLSHRNVQSRGFDKAAERAGIEGGVLHSLRNAFASRMIAGGGNSIELAKVMGHESGAVTERVYIALYFGERVIVRLWPPQTIAV